MTITKADRKLYYKEAIAALHLVLGTVEKCDKVFASCLIQDEFFHAIGTEEEGIEKRDNLGWKHIVLDIKCFSSKKG